MSLGETIYRLRTEKSLSQGGLAELLDVSRQSISKWENNSAVPDLDKLKKNAGLWCAWAVFFLVDIYMILATGIQRSSVLYIFQWEPHMNYMRLAFAWASLIALIILIGVTVARFRIGKCQDEKRVLRNLIVSWGVLVGLQIIAFVWPRTGIFSYLLAHILSMSTIYTLVSICLEWARIVALTVALVNTVRFLRRRKAIN